MGDPVTKFTNREVRALRALVGDRGSGTEGPIEGTTGSFSGAVTAGSFVGPLTGNAASSTDGAAAKAVTDAATAANTAGAVVKRGASGEIAVGAVNGFIERLIGSGTATSIPTAANTVVGTFTRQAGETVRMEGFITDDAAVSWDNDTIYPNEGRTTNANEFQAKWINVSGTNRSVDWKVWGKKAAP